MESNYKRVEEIAGKFLGQKGGEGYKDQYDPSLLVGIPRHYNRTDYGIEEENLPFVGYDVWNAYEVSALTEKGFPVTGMMKIVCPADTPKHVESKSIKLYLNSFNMTKMGKTIKECIMIIEGRVVHDLNKVLEVKEGSSVMATMFRNTDQAINTPFNYVERQQVDNIEDLINLDSLEFTTFKSDSSQLEVSDTGPGMVNVYIDFLRSNCRVTNQPDWGKLIINLNGDKLPTYESLAKYVVSHRQVNHFHEEIVEMVYMHLLEKFNPEQLTVTALYTRRGGLDINPIRSNRSINIPACFIDPFIINSKTINQ